MRGVVIAMGRESTYVSELKAELAQLPTRFSCCRRALLAGLLYNRSPKTGGEIGELTSRLEKEFENDFQNSEFTDIEAFFKCAGCIPSFVRGLFLSCGVMSDPETEYRLEFPMYSDDSAEQLKNILSGIGIETKTVRRRGRPVVYSKESGMIEDLLGIMGSKKSVFELMNIKIKHDIRNNANRRTNCDAANIRKTVTASGEQYEAILRLRDSGELEKLPDELRETALLRLENSNISLSALAALHREPISRSGVNHRLSKLIELADGIADRRSTKSDEAGEHEAK